MIILPLSTHDGKNPHALRIAQHSPPWWLIKRILQITVIHPETMSHTMERNYLVTIKHRNPLNVNDPVEGNISNICLATGNVSTTSPT